MATVCFSSSSSISVSPTSAHSPSPSTTCSSTCHSHKYSVSSLSSSTFTRRLPINKLNALLYPISIPVSADSTQPDSPPTSPITHHDLERISKREENNNKLNNNNNGSDDKDVRIPISTTTSNPSKISHIQTTPTTTTKTSIPIPSKVPLHNATTPPTLLPTFQSPQALNIGSHRMRIFSGSSNTKLSHDIANYIGKQECSAMLRKVFADGETYVRIEESVRGCNVFLIQSTSNPTNDNLIELLLMIDACRRASAYQITAVIPYYGYARADRLVDPDRRRREALTSKLVANMLSIAGIDRIILVDIHSPQTCGFFDIPVDHVYATSVLINYINQKQLDDLVIVSPDVGGVARARAFAKGCMDSPLAIIDKRRDDHNTSTVLNLVGDVKNKTAIIIDDMIDTAGTICQAAKMLRLRGARQVFALATHAVFSGPAVDRLSSGVFEEVIVTNSIDIPEEKRFKQLTVLSIANVLGEQIWRIHEQSSR